MSWFSIIFLLVLSEKGSNYLDGANGEEHSPRSLHIFRWSSHLNSGHRLVHWLRTQSKPHPMVGIPSSLFAYALASLWSSFQSRKWRARTCTLEGVAELWWTWYSLECLHCFAYDKCHCSLDIEISWARESWVKWRCSPSGCRTSSCTVVTKKMSTWLLQHRQPGQVPEYLKQE